MRKILLTSTALVGAFALVDRADAQQLTTDSPFTVRIDGFANFRGGFVSQSNQTAVPAASSNPVRNRAPQIVGRTDNFRTDTEIHITATGKADNGLVYGMYVEIEADPALNTLTTSATNISGTTQTTIPTSGNNYIDEANIFLQGSWGRIEMGDQDGAGDQLFFGAPFDYGPAYGANSGRDGDLFERWVNSVGGNYNIFSSNISATPAYGFNIQALDSADVTKITYLTPVISGFRAGISYAPDGAQNGNLPTNNQTAAGTSSVTITSLSPTSSVFNGITGVAGAPAGTTAPAAGRSALAQPQGAFGDYQQWIEIGAQWRGTIGDVGLGFTGEYTHATHKKSINFGTAPGGAINGTQFGTAGGYNFVDINSFAFGTQVSWMGFTVGGSYSNWGRSTYLTGPGLLRGGDGYAVAAGIQYAIGPWVVGYNYAYTQQSPNVSPSNTGGFSNNLELHSVGAKYILAPGLFVFAEYDHFTIMNSGINVNNGDVTMLGTGIRF
jgi:hypothetical protein